MQDRPGLQHAHVQMICFIPEYIMDINPDKFVIVDFKSTYFTLEPKFLDQDPIDLLSSHNFYFIQRY